jgi:GTP-binding protein LepA
MFILVKLIMIQNKDLEIKKIRNFAIIAHIDHGKSTLSDRIISICGGLSEREMKDQVLDSLNVERQRGITVKAQSVSLKFEHKGEKYTLNLIDTPGHVDFSYEVKRSLSACEGVVLLVDAKQGIQAQTVANVRIAKEKGLEIIPVLNKIDLLGANPDYVANRIKDLLKIEKKPLLVSAKTGVGVKELLAEIIEHIPSPIGFFEKPLQALVVDSWYDQHAGIIILSRILNGSIRKNTRIMFLSNGREYKVDSVGVFTPKKEETDELSAGMVGYVIANIRNIQDCAPGDTVGEVGNKCEKLPGFVKMNPYVFCGIYPEAKNEYLHLKKSLERLELNDVGIFVQPSNIPVLGSGFRCGFLGLLHLEVVQQRLSEEFNIEM